MNGSPVLSDARIPQDEVGALYDRLAWMYDPWGVLTESRARNRSLELAAVEDGQSILEVAVGTGLAFERVVRSNPGGINVGIDLSKGMLEKAKARLKKAGLSNHDLSVGSAFRIEHGPAQFDTLLNSYMFRSPDGGGLGGRSGGISPSAQTRWKAGSCKYDPRRTPREPHL